MSFNILFMGTPHFSKQFLKHIYKNKKFNIVGVYTQPPKKSHRGQKINNSEVHEFAKENKINVFCPIKFSTKDINNIKKINPDVILVVAYGIILPKEVLIIPSCGAVNVHASLLPKWRGAAPIQRAIMNGDKLTGISIMKMEEKLDEGPTYLQSEIQINENDTYEKIYNNLIDVGKETLDFYFSRHQPYLPVNQDSKFATYAKKITKKEMQINFNETAFMVHKKICALSPKPGAWFDLDSNKYKIFDTKIIKKENLKNYNKESNLILSFKKDYLVVEKIQKEGKKIMSVKDFGRGYSKELEKIKKKFSIKS
jgi:methionyl-tRNA formyltransferase